MQTVLYVVSSICLVIISVTMFARANDLDTQKMTRWRVRLFGLVLSCGGSIATVLYGLGDRFLPMYPMTATLVGLTVVLMTTPYLPPWEVWIWKGDRRSVDREN